MVCNIVAKHNTNTNILSECILPAVPQEPRATFAQGKFSIHRTIGLILAPPLQLHEYEYVKYLL